jgi:hypothetical protein
VSDDLPPTRKFGIIEHAGLREFSEDPPNNLRNPMISFMALDSTKNQESIKEAKSRIRELNKRIQGLQNGKHLVKEVLH